MKDQQQNPSTNGVHSHIQPALHPQGTPSGDAFTAQRPRFEMPETPEPLSRTEQRSANRRTLFVVLLIMAGMAILGLLFALYTVPQRRANDIKPTTASQRAPL
jgi:hypothetical protein